MSSESSRVTTGLPGSNATSTWTAPLVLAFVALLGIFPLLPQRLPWLALSCVSLALTYGSARIRAKPALHVGVLCSLLLVVLAAFGSMLLWPLPPILATLAYVVVAKRWAALGGLPPSWFRGGNLERGTWGLIIASLLVSSSALLVWFAVAKPDYSQFVTLFPKLPTYVLLAGVVLFSMLNAALEETIYRGVVLGALDASLGAGVASVVLQAAVFGLAHIGGFPRGAVGVGLAMIYGTMMAVVRRRAGGMLAPWIAHVGTDIAIGSLLLSTRAA